MNNLLRPLLTAAIVLASATADGNDDSRADAAAAESQERPGENRTGDDDSNERSEKSDWLPHNLRVILPENLEDMHRLDVSGPEPAEQDAPAASAPSSPYTGETASDTEWSGPRDAVTSTEEDLPVVLDQTDKLIKLSRLPLTYVQERMPFLTNRKIIFFGRIEPELVSYSNGVLEEDSGFHIRRFRLGLAGRIRRWPNWQYKVEVDLTDSQNTVSDAYLSWQSTDWGRIRLGNQKVAQTLSGQTSSISTTFMERPLPVLAFTLERRFGIGYELHRKRWGANATLISADLNKGKGRRGYAVRTYYNLVKNDSRVLHLGASYMDLLNDDDAQLRARPESNRTDTRLVDTGKYPDVDDSSSVGVELAGAWGPVSLKSEFYETRWDGGDEGDSEFDGWYAEGSWFVTGTRHHYREGKFIRPNIRDQNGAWEVAMRYSSVDLNDGQVAGGWEDNLSLGLNWYSRVHWRFMGNVIKVDADGPKGEQDPWIVQVRVQYYF